MSSWKGLAKNHQLELCFFVKLFHVQKRDVAKKKRESEQNDIYPVHQLYIVYIHPSKKNPTHFVHHFCCCLGRGFPRRPPWRPLLRWIAWLPPAAPWRRGSAPPWRGPRRPSKRPTPKSVIPPWGCFRRGEVKGWKTPTKTSRKLVGNDGTVKCFLSFEFCILTMRNCLVGGNLKCSTGVIVLIRQRWR